MVRPWEHVDGLAAADTVAVGRQIRDVARLRLGVAGDVDDAGRSHAADGLEEVAAAARARRVHQHHVDALPGFGGVLQELARVSRVKARVRHAVALRVLRGVAGGGGIQLHADHPSLRHGRARGKPDGSHAAVRVKDGLVPGELRHLNRRAVQPLRLHRIDLIERRGRDAERQPAQLVLNHAGAVKDVLLVAENHARVPAVDVQHDRRDLRVQLQKGAQKVVFRGEDGRRADESHKILARRPAAADEHMAQHAAPRVLVVRDDVEFRQEAADVGDDVSGVLVLDHAMLHLYDVMRARLVDSADKFPAHHAERRLHLAAVVLRILHSEDGADPAEPPEQAHDESLLPAELVGVFHILQLAAAAFAEIRAALAFRPLCAALLCGSRSLRLPGEGLRPRACGLRLLRTAGNAAFPVRRAAVFLPPRRARIRRIVSRAGTGRRSPRGSVDRGRACRAASGRPLFSVIPLHSPQPLTATASASNSASFGRAATCTQERAGKLEVKKRA